MGSFNTFPDPSSCAVVQLRKNLFECLTDDAFECPYAVPFGYTYFCRCPSRGEISSGK